MATNQADVTTNASSKEDVQSSGTAWTTDPKIWKQRYTLAYNNQKPMFKKFAEWYEIMYAIKTYKNISIWKSKVFIPIMSYKAWTIIAKLLALKPGFSVQIFDKVYSNEDRKAIEKANIKLQYDYDNPNLDETIRDREFDMLADAVVCGTGMGLAKWCTTKKKLYQHFTKPDGTIDYTKAKVTESEEGYNDLDPINIFDTFGQPGHRSWEDKEWIILHFSRSRSKLLAAGFYKDDIIKNLKPLGKRRDEITKYKQSRNQLIGQSNADQDSLDDTTDNFDIFECYEKKSGVHLCTFAEAAVMPGKQVDAKSEDGNWFNIREEDQPYWHGKYPTIPFHIRRRPHDCWGESIFEVTESMSNAYNDIFNQFMDNLNIVGNGGILMHDTGTTIYDFLYEPGGEIRYSGTAPTFETPASPDKEFFNMMMGFLEKGVEWGTVSDYSSGTPSSATDKTAGTASGIQRLQEAAGEIVTFMKSNFMQSLKQVGMRWLSNNRQFLDDDMMLQTQKNGKTVPLPVSGTDFTETMVVTIDEDSMEPPSKQDRLQNTSAWLTQMFAIQTQSYIQAGLVPPQKGMQPQAPPQDATGQPLVKPLLFNMERLAQEVSDDYNKTDLEQFFAGSTDNGQPGMQSNTDLVNALRAMVSNGDIDPKDAQFVIDQLEGREPITNDTTTGEAESTGQDAGGPANPTDQSSSPLSAGQGAAAASGLAGAGEPPAGYGAA
jgi:hypothetical protein